MYPAIHATGQHKFNQAAVVHRNRPVGQRLRGVGEAVAGLRESLAGFFQLLANAVEVGAAALFEPTAPLRVARELDDLLDERPELADKLAKGETWR